MTGNLSRNRLLGLASPFITILIALLATTVLAQTAPPAMVRCSTTEKASPALNSGNPLFVPPVTYNSGGSASAVAVADVNGDGKPDLLVANGGGTEVCCWATVTGLSSRQ